MMHETILIDTKGKERTYGFTFQIETGKGVDGSVMYISGFFWKGKHERCVDVIRVREGEEMVRRQGTMEG